ncbi:phage gp6-like head-tail connector protein [Staphylococcus xylosus]
MISKRHVEIMKNRLKIFHSFEDDHIKSLLEDSYSDIKNRCENFSMDNSKKGAELVYERTRYAYNDSLEFFHANFIALITDFALENTGDLND